MIELFAQAEVAGTLELIKLAVSGGSLMLTLILGWYFHGRLDKQEVRFDGKLREQADDCKDERNASSKTFLEALERITDKHRDTNKEATAALRETNKTLARATYVQEVALTRMKICPVEGIETLDTDPSQSAIVRADQAFKKKYDNP